MKKVMATVAVVGTIALAGEANASTTIDVAFDTNLDSGFTGTVTIAAGPFNSGDFVAGTAWVSEDGTKHYCLKGVIREGQTTGPHNQDSCFAMGMGKADGSTEKVIFVVLDQYLDGFTTNTDQTNSN